MVTHGATILAFAAQVPYTAVVSRLLVPSDFGLVALAGVVLRFTSYFASAGVVTAVIQRAELTDRDLRAAFTLSLAASITACLAIAALAPQLAIFFDNSDVVVIARALSLSLVLTAVGNTGLGLLRRSGRFRTLAMIDLASYVIAYPVVGITLALLDFGVWSLVFATLVQAGVSSIATIACARPPLRPTYSSKDIVPIARFGSGVSAIGFLEFFSTNTDTMAVGRYAGASALGQYSRASLLFGLPMYHLTNNTVKVLFPRFARERANRSVLAATYQRGMILLLGMFAPLCVLTFFVSHALVRLVLGPGWNLAASLVPLVSIAMAVDLASHLPGAVYEALGRLRLRIAVQALHLATIVLVVGLVVSRGSSVHALAGAWIVGQVARHAGFLVTLPSVLGMRFKTLLRPYVEAALLAAAALLGCSAGAAAAGGSDLAHLIVPSLGGALATAVAVRMIPGLWFRRELVMLPLGARLKLLIGDEK